MSIPLTLIGGAVRRGGGGASTSITLDDSHNESGSTVDHDFTFSSTGDYLILCTGQLSSGGGWNTPTLTNVTGSYSSITTLFDFQNGSFESIALYHVVIDGTGTINLSSNHSSTHYRSITCVFSITGVDTGSITKTDEGPVGSQTGTFSWTPGSGASTIFAFLMRNSSNPGDVTITPSGGTFHRDGFAFSSFQYWIYSKGDHDGSQIDADWDMGASYTTGRDLKAQFTLPAA